MGYAPDWARGSMKKAGQVPVKQGVVSKPLFHSEVRGYADGEIVIPEATRGEATELSNGVTAYKVDLPGTTSQAEAPAETTTAPAQSEEKSDDFTSKGKFGSAFAAARAGGLKEFTWNGNRYGTQLATEDKRRGSQRAPARDTSADDAMRNYDQTYDPEKYAPRMHDESQGNYDHLSTRPRRRIGPLITPRTK